MISRTCPQVTVRHLGLYLHYFQSDVLGSQGLYVVTDLFPFHLQARKVGCPPLLIALY